MTAIDAGPAAPSPAPPGVERHPAAERDADLILARVHLRLGSLSLARAELETLAGAARLDDEGIRDLAEARWRTGDLGGAGDAAAAWLEHQPDDVLGLVIAAESQSALGRPGEARRLAGRAMERAEGSLDPVFAGMQRSAIWPVEAGAGGPVGVLFDDLHPGPLAVRPLPVDARVLALGGSPIGFGSEGATSRGAGHQGGPSLWGDDPTTDEGPIDALDPAELFHRARTVLEAGDAADAATGLILALRGSPALAPAILDLLSGRGEPILALVRGDAQRIVGHEVEAMRDHAVAAGAVAPVAARHHEHHPVVVDDGPDGADAPTDAGSDEPDTTSPDQEIP